MTAARAVVFAGPSLPPGDRLAGAAFEWSPPAGAGDLLRLLSRPPAIVCLIDGFFDDRPAPWHKEIVALMAAGVTVFGASSMGALRAAELHGLGMIGVGRIFDAYARGLLTGDDEVACVHAPGELDWAPLTVPMVEMRATLLAAVRAGLIGGATARAIRSAAHDVHFAVRDWPALARACVDHGLIRGDAFDRLRRAHVPLKRLDAIACLQLAASWTKPPVGVAPPPGTCYFRALVEETAAAGSSLATTSRNAAPVPSGNG